MEIPEIIVTGIIGNKLPDRIVKTLQNGFSLLVCSEANRALICAELEEDIIDSWVSFSPIDHCCQRIEESVKYGTVIVLTSGDALFYGFGSTLRKRMPKARITFEPSISSMQLCFSRFGISWEKADFVSLHGRPLKELSTKLSKGLLFVFTDPINSPKKVSNYIIDLVGDTKQSDFDVYVAEKLGMEGERLFSGTPRQTIDQDFSQPNCMIIKNNCKNKYRYRLGLRETDIEHSRGLITKREIRAITLHTLALPKEGVFWDIGSGSGSISIEAARMNPGLNVYAMERRSEEIENITRNKMRFNCPNLSVIHGEAPEILDNLPRPDRVFIGGSGGKLESIICWLSNNACENELIVINGVTEKTCIQTPKILAKFGYNSESSIVSVKRVQGMMEEGKTETFNTIHIIRAEKKK